MAWVKFKRASNGTDVYVNMDLVSHIEVEPDKHTYLYFGTDDADTPASAVWVDGAPEDILKAVSASLLDFTKRDEAVLAEAPKAPEET